MQSSRNAPEFSFLAPPLTLTASQKRSNNSRAVRSGLPPSFLPRQPSGNVAGLPDAAQTSCCKSPFQGFRAGGERRISRDSLVRGPGKWSELQLCSQAAAFQSRLSQGLLVRSSRRQSSLGWGFQPEPLTHSRAKQSKESAFLFSQENKPSSAAASIGCGGRGCFSPSWGESASWGGREKEPIIKLSTSRSERKSFSGKRSPPKWRAGASSPALEFRY